MNDTPDLSHVIEPAAINTLAQLLIERVRRTPQQEAYRQYDALMQCWRSTTWVDALYEVKRWRLALQNEALPPGARVGIMLGNCREWVFMEQAALGLGLVVVPLFTNDRAENVGYILADADVKVVLIDGDEHLELLRPIHPQLAKLVRLLTLQPGTGEPGLDNLRAVSAWLPSNAPAFAPHAGQSGDLATIVYTSGTTGRPKGVMLSHKNILSNAYAGVVYTVPNDLFLSFLPLSHMLERTLGYYIPMMTGATVAFARSVPQLGEDLVMIRPTLLISVPRIYERVYARIQEQLATKSGFARALFTAAVNVGWERFLMQQGRGGWSPKLLLWPLLYRLVARKVLGKLGGRLRVAIAGGAALAPHIAKTFIGLGLPLIQGYGLTETSPIISGNKLNDNIPESVGEPLFGVQVRVAENGELLAKGDGIMLGYWNCPEATQRIIDADGWLHTGDKARIESNHIFITGRLKEIIVLANGEKVAPGDMEQAIAADPLFEHVMIVGEGRPFLAALVSLQGDQWQKLAASLGVNPDDGRVLGSKPVIDELLSRITLRTGAFPGYAQIRRVVVTPEAWSIENGLITPTLKLRRERILAYFPAQVQQLYAGH
ncbi:MAG: long-chain fatty acid--CoA ligase [Gammaproteobacteria bacterium]|nr:long-chain fatty acid--CoA ligase [Gammaproteobacteria bacterium]